MSALTCSSALLQSSALVQLFWEELGQCGEIIRFQFLLTPILYFSAEQKNETDSKTLAS
jgi:hypothetical protein